MAKITTTFAFTNKGNIRMIAHRGLSGLERENTAAAFVAAGQRSYYGVESDVRATADGKLVMFHDDNLKRLAGVGKRVEDLTFSELRQLRFLDVDEKTPRGDLLIPTLEEYLWICDKYDKEAVLEIKDMSLESVDRVYETVKASGWLKHTTFISFFREKLLRLREIAPNVKAQFLSGEASEKTVRFMIDNRLDADLSAGVVTEKLVERLHKAGLKVNCWTVDDLALAEKMRRAGVDYITSDILE